MDIILLKLLIAHFLGDFFFQFDSWVEEKEKKKLRSPKLYLHILIHGLLLGLLIWDLSLWFPIVILIISHGLIDAIKLTFQKQNTKRLWFFADQILHLISIGVIWSVIVNPEVNFSLLNNPVVWVYLLTIILLTFPSSIIIKVLIAKWTPNATLPTIKEASLQSAGKYIGIMERLLVFIFVCTNHFEAIGFLIAAKSIFRFGDLKEGNELKLTEYILIGTLLSFGIAIILSLAAKALVV